MQNLKFTSVFLLILESFLTPVLLQVQLKSSVLVPKLGHPETQGGDGCSRREGDEPQCQLQVHGAPCRRGNGECIQRRVLRGVRRGGQRAGQHRGADLHGSEMCLLQ